MSHVSRVIAFASIVGLAGCAVKQLSPEEIAKLTGGQTTVVVYGFCVPMDHLINVTMTRYTMTFVVNGKDIGTMETCSSATFTVPSGYWDAKFVPTGLGWPVSLPKKIFRPGETQYLYMSPSGYNSYRGHWVSKDQAEKGIAEIKEIKQVF